MIDPCLAEWTLRIGGEGLHACSTDFQVKECFQDKRARELFTIIDLEDQIKDLEDVCSTDDGGHDGGDRDEIVAQ